MFKFSLARLLSVVGLLGLLAAALPYRAAAANATLSVSPAQGPVGTAYVIGGAGWPAYSYVLVNFGDPQKQLATWFIGAVGGYADAQGNLRLQGVIPASYQSMSAGTQQVTPGVYAMIASVQSGPTAQTLFTVTGGSGGPPSPTGFEAVARFQEYYSGHQGLRLLGYAISNETVLNQPINGQSVAVPVQYFQKGRIEDHRAAGATGAWATQYGLLVPGLISAGSALGISNSSVTYQQLRALADGSQRIAPPAGFTGGTWQPLPGADVFIPQSPNLSPAPGYPVPAVFWTYMNSGVFPAGWLHDLGLPLSRVFAGTVLKSGQPRAITMQAFERGILTYDAQNPADFQVERANVGADYLAVGLGNAPPPTPAQSATAVVTAYWTHIGLQDYETAYNLLASPYRQQVSLPQFCDITRGAIAGVSNVQVTNVQSQANGRLQLTVSVTLQVGLQPSNYHNGVNVVYVTMVPEAGGWRIAGLASSP